LEGVELDVNFSLNSKLKKSKCIFLNIFLISKFIYFKAKIFAIFQIDTTLKISI